MKTDDHVWAWGDNSYGQIGNSSFGMQLYPYHLSVLGPCLAVSPGYYYTMAIKADGSLWGWGNNVSGELGQGSNLNEPTPVQIGAASDWAAVDGGFAHTQALRSDGGRWTWGENPQGQLGTGDLQNQPAPVLAGTGWTWVMAGNAFNFGAQSDGLLLSWGGGGAGTLGNGSLNNQPNPGPVSGSSGTATVMVTVVPVSVQEVDPGSGFSLRPNPAQGRVVLYVDDANIGATWSLTDQLGRVLHTGRVLHDGMSIDLDAIPPGVYGLRIDKTGRSSCARLVVR